MTTLKEHLICRGHNTYDTYVTLILEYLRNWSMAGTISLEHLDNKASAPDSYLLIIAHPSAPPSR